MTRRLATALAVTFATAFVVCIGTMTYWDRSAEPVEVRGWYGNPEGFAITLPPDPVWPDPAAWGQSWAIGLAVGVLSGAVFYSLARRTSGPAALSGEREGEP